MTPDENRPQNPIAQSPEPGAQQRGEVTALLMKHRLELYAYLRAAIGNHHDAEDLLQEVSIAASNDFQQFRSGTNFRAWVREIARRRILNHHRQSGRRTALLQPAVLEQLEQAARAVEQKSPANLRRDALNQCLEKIEGAARRVLTMRYESDWEVERIAGVIGKSVQATYAILKRTRQVLRDCVDHRVAGEAQG